MSEQPFETLKIDDLYENLDKIENLVSNKVKEIISDTNACKHSAITYRAEWHVKGIVYHLRRILNFYSKSASAARKRANCGANIIFMNEPYLQNLWFEFYSLINLVKISLDKLREFLSPVFLTNVGNIPKSLRMVLKGNSDCPVHKKLSEDFATLNYIFDIRNCIVHYHSFACNNNTVVIEEGVDLSRLSDDFGTISGPMARAFFRKTESEAIVYNIYLPDKIFEYNKKGKKCGMVSTFKYEQQYNLLAQSYRFVETTSLAILESLKLLIDLGKPTYFWEKGSVDKK